MSKWSDHYNNHPFLGSWENLLNLSADDALDKIVSKDTVEDLARLRKALSYLNSIVKNIDPDLFPFHLLTNMQSQTQGCLNQLNSFKGNKNVGHLQNANNHIDQLLAIFQQLPASMYSLSTEDVTQAVTAYSTTIGSYIEEYKNATEDSIVKLKNKIDTLNTDILEKEKKLETLNSELKNISQTIQQQTAEFNTQYQESEKERTKKFESVYTKYTEKADKEFENLSLKSSKIIEVLLKLQDDAAKVYNVTINALQGGAYSSYANEERKIANFLRFIAGFLMVLAVALLVVPELVQLLDDTKDYIFDWKKTLGRVPLSLVVFVPAFYLAKESTKHRNNEITNRRRQHILSTLDPYIELMDQDKAQELKSHVAKTIFSEASIETESTNDTSNIIALLTNFAKQIKGK